MEEMIENGQGRAGAMFVGLLFGVAIGAALGLMFAPKPGAELRRDVQAQARQLKRRASAAYNQASEGVNTVMEKGRTAFEAGRDAYRSSRPESATIS